MRRALARCPRTSSRRGSRRGQRCRDVGHPARRTFGYRNAENIGERSECACECEQPGESCAAETQSHHAEADIDDKSPKLRQQPGVLHDIEIHLENERDAQGEQCRRQDRRSAASAESDRQTPATWIHPVPQTNPRQPPVLWATPREALTKLFWPSLTLGFPDLSITTGTHSSRSRPVVTKRSASLSKSE